MTNRLNQQEIIEVLNKLEAEDEIIYHSAYGFDVWPIIKIVVFNAWFQNESTGFFLLKESYKKLNSLKHQKRSINCSNIKPSGIWVCVPMTTREKFKDVSYDKFGDPILDSAKDFDTNLLIYQKTEDFNNYYRNDRIVDISSGALSVKADKVYLDQIILNILRYVSKETNISFFILKRRVKNYITNVNSWYKYFKGLINLYTPYEIKVVCYYNEPMFALMRAAKESGISTTDIQHGSLGKDHPAYHYVHRDILKGNLLPSYMWVWNEDVRKYFQTWIPDYCSNRVLVNGNPWIDFLSEKNLQLKEEGEILVLYTLQLDVKTSLPAYLIKAISESDKKYLWWFRHHPRASSKYKRQIEKILKDNNIQNRVFFKEANDLPLPIVMKEVDVHFTKSSGAVYEANILGVPVNITTSKTGSIYFKELIENRNLVYYDNHKTDFLTFVENKLQKR